MALEVRERIGRKEVVREIVGRVASSNLWTMRAASTIDTTQTDYGYWDRLRRGMVQGAKLAGLFAKPAAEIKTDWIMGDGYKVELAVEESLKNSPNVEYTNKLLTGLTVRSKATMMQMINDLKSEGDQYVVINADGSLSIPSPDTVKYEYDELDYRQPKRAVITTKTTKFTATDEYRLDGRTLTIDTQDKVLASDLLADGYESTGNNKYQKTFENLIGRLPVVHFANDRSANETHGRPMYEALLHLFGRYDAELEKALDAAEIMSNPIPVFTLEDTDASEDANANPDPEQWTDTNGTTRTRTQIEFDRFATIFLRILDDGTKEGFDLVSPDSGYTNDIKAMLKVLFLLILEHLRIPEVVWGGELGQARASASEQMKTFYMHIAGERLRLEGAGADELLGMSAQGGIHEVMDIWLKMRALWDRQVVVAPVRVKWSALGEADDAQNLAWAKQMKADGVITDETYVGMSGRVEDAAAEVEAARAEMAEKQDGFDAAVDAAANQPDPVAPDTAQDNAA